MFKILKRVVRAPLSYLADLRKLSFRQYLMLHNKFSPTYPIMIFTALLSTLSLASFIIYFIFTTTGASICFDNVRGGAYVISILYPIQTILCFICLTATISLAKSSCWKIIWILLFGPVLSGFGFGELALIEMCLLGTQNQQTFNIIGLLKQPSFIAAMIYLYISLVALYFVLVPSIEYLYKRQKEDELKEQQLKKAESNKKKSISKPGQSELQKYADVEQAGQKSKKSCCSRFICIMYYFLHILFLIAALFILLFKILGPVLFTYIWIEMATSPYNFNGDQEKIIFSLSLVAYFSPLGVTLIVLLIQAVVKLVKNKPQLQEQVPESTARQTIQITQGSDRTSKLENKEIHVQQKENHSKNINQQPELAENIQKELNPMQMPSSAYKNQRKQSLI